MAEVNIVDHTKLTLYNDINRIGESINNIENTISKENEDLKEKLKLMEKELEDLETKLQAANQEIEEYREMNSTLEKKYENLVKDNYDQYDALNRLKFRSVDIIDAMEEIVGKLKLSYDESEIRNSFGGKNFKFKSREESPSDCDADDLLVCYSRDFALIHISRFLLSIKANNKAGCKRILKLMAKHYKTFVISDETV